MPQKCPVQVHLAELLQVVHHVLVRELQELQTELVARRLPVAAAAAVVVVDDAEAPRVEVLDEAREDEVGVIADDDLALLMALASHQHIVAVTVTWGNAPAALCYTAAKALLGRIGRADVPRHRGPKFRPSG